MTNQLDVARKASATIVDTSPIIANLEANERNQQLEQIATEIERGQQDARSAASEDSVDAQTTSALNLQAEASRSYQDKLDRADSATKRKTGRQDKAFDFQRGIQSESDKFQDQQLGQEFEQRKYTMNAEYVHKWDELQSRQNLEALKFAGSTMMKVGEVGYGTVASYLATRNANRISKAMFESEERLKDMVMKVDMAAPDQKQELEEQLQQQIDQEAKTMDEYIGQNSFGINREAVLGDYLKFSSNLQRGVVMSGQKRKVAELKSDYEKSVSKVHNHALENYDQYPNMVEYADEVSSKSRFTQIMPQSEINHDAKNAVVSGALNGAFLDKNIGFMEEVLKDETSKEFLTDKQFTAFNKKLNMLKKSGLDKVSTSNFKATLSSLSEKADRDDVQNAIANGGAFAPANQVAVEYMARFMDASNPPDQEEYLNKMMSALPADTAKDQKVRDAAKKFLITAKDNIQRDPNQFYNNITGRKESPKETLVRHQAGETKRYLTNQLAVSTANSMVKVLADGGKEGFGAWFQETTDKWGTEHVFGMLQESVNIAKNEETFRGASPESKKRMMLLQSVNRLINGQKDKDSTNRRQFNEDEAVNVVKNGLQKAPVNHIPSSFRRNKIEPEDQERFAMMEQLAIHDTNEFFRRNPDNKPEKEAYKEQYVKNLEARADSYFAGIYSDEGGMLGVTNKVRMNVQDIRAKAPQDADRIMDTANSITNVNHLRRYAKAGAFDEETTRILNDGVFTGDASPVLLESHEGSKDGNPVLVLRYRDSTNPDGPAFNKIVRDQEGNQLSFTTSDLVSTDGNYLKLIEKGKTLEGIKSLAQKEKVEGIKRKRKASKVGQTSYLGAGAGSLTGGASEGDQTVAIEDAIYVGLHATGKAAIDAAKLLFGLPHKIASKINNSVPLTREGFRKLREERDQTRQKEDTLLDQYESGQIDTLEPDTITDQQGNINVPPEQQPVNLFTQPLTSTVSNNPTAGTVLNNIKNNNVTETFNEAVNAPKAGGGEFFSDPVTLGSTFFNLVKQESQFKADAKSDRDAYGMAQIRITDGLSQKGEGGRDYWAGLLGSKNDVKSLREAANDPKKAIPAGMAHYDNLLQKASKFTQGLDFGNALAHEIGNAKLAALVYNAGPSFLTEQTARDIQAGRPVNAGMWRDKGNLEAIFYPYKVVGEQIQDKERFLTDMRGLLSRQNTGGQWVGQLDDPVRLEKAMKVWNAGSKEGVIDKILRAAKVKMRYLEEGNRQLGLIRSNLRI